MSYINNSITYFFKLEGFVNGYYNIKVDQLTFDQSRSTCDQLTSRQPGCLTFSNIIIYFKN